MDKTALQGHGMDYKHNFTLLLQVNKHHFGRSPAGLQSTTQPVACRLLQPRAVLSAQIITKDRPPSKQAFQTNTHFSCFPEKNVPAVRSPSHSKGIFRLLLKPSTQTRALRITSLCPTQNKKQELTKGES